MRAFHADLHIHTCLSPCAALEMLPTMVVQRACEMGMDMIAICDHNSVENVGAVRCVAERLGVAVICGMEITSREEVHVLGLFQDEQLIESVQTAVYEHLPGENDAEAFGEQLVVNAQDRLIRRNERLLIGATTLTLTEIIAMIHKARGIAIASHIDRPSFSLLSQLGFVPEGLALDGVEVANNTAAELPEHLSVVSSSDAHYPDEVGSKCTCFFIEEPSLSAR